MLLFLSGFPGAACAVQSDTDIALDEKLGNALPTEAFFFDENGNRVALGDGGTFFDPQFPVLCFLFFMWQIPHFWLQVLHDGEEYHRAGLPSFISLANRTEIARINFAWISAVSASTLLLPLYGVLQYPALCFLLLPGYGMAVGKRIQDHNGDGNPKPRSFRF